MPIASNVSRPPQPAQSRAPSRAPDLARLAAARARERGWQLLGTLSAAPDELRQLIRAPEQVHPVVACLRSGTDAAAATAREAAARRDAYSEHVVGVLGGEVSRGLPEGWLIVEHAPGGTLAALLARRRLIRADEAATILIGVASGLGALHEAGWSAPDLGLDGVVFRRDGCPAIDALRRAGPLTASAAATDRLAYRAVAKNLSAAVPAPGGWRLLDAVDAALAPSQAGGDHTPTAVWERVVAGVLATVEPGAVRLAEHGGPLASRPPTLGLGDLTPDGLPPEDRDEPPDAPRRSQGELMDAGLSGIRGRAAPTSLREPAAGRLAAASGRLRDTELVTHGVSTAASDPVSAFEPARELSDLLLDGKPVAHVADRVRAWLAARKKLVGIVLIPAVVVGVALLLLPGGEASNASSSTGPSTAAGSPEASRPSTSAAFPAGETSAGGPRPTTAPASSAASSEPVAAATQLLRARHQCFAARVRQGSCLDKLVQDDSPVAASDRAALDDGTPADGYDFSGAAVELVQRWGEAALVSVAPDRARTPKSEPASLLMVRSEAGWRLREVFP